MNQSSYYKSQKYNYIFTIFNFFYFIVFFFINIKILTIVTRIVQTYNESKQKKIIKYTTLKL